MGEISLHSRRKLKPADAQRFARLEPDLFVSLATVVCSTGRLPQKELHECWQMATCVHREFPDSLRVADLAAGHGLLAWILVLLARSGEHRVLRTAVAIDIKRPKSAGILAAAMTARWPNLADAVHYVEGSVDAVSSEPGSRPLFVAAHACGGLSDRVLLAAIASQSPVAIMPCCHSLRKQAPSLSSLALASGLPSNAVDNVTASASALGLPTSIDRFRIEALTALGYEVREAFIHPEITTFNRIIMGNPPHATDRDVASARHISPPSGAPVKRFGEIRAYESVRSLNVSNATEARALSKRPSREWRRSFDVSYWVDDEATGRRLGSALDFFTDRFLASGGIASSRGGDGAFTRNVSICGQYAHPVTRRTAFSYRIEIGSATLEITKPDAMALRRRLCRALKCLAHLRRAEFELRGLHPDPKPGRSP